MRLQKNHLKTNNKGFSLVELIIVIAIMAILAGAIAPALIRYIDKARASRATEEARVIVNAVQTSIAENVGEDIDLCIDKSFVNSSGVTEDCGIITNWIIAQAQENDTSGITPNDEADYKFSEDILENLCSGNSSSFKFYKFNGAAQNPIGANCASFTNSYGCPGVIVIYNRAGQVIFLEYYNHNCLVRYEDGAYKVVEDESFTGNSRIQY